MTPFRAAVPRSVTVRTIVPIYLGLDEKNGKHYFDPVQTQEVEITAWYVAADKTFELAHGVNLYTGGAMSVNWLRGLEKDEQFAYSLASKLNNAYADKHDTGPQPPPSIPLPSTASTTEPVE